MGKIIFVSGGVSSGKSDFAEKLCREREGKILYIATSLPLDEEMKEKKRKHIEKRAGMNWDTLEKYRGLYKDVEKISEKYSTALLDCITMMVSNLIFEDDFNFDAEDIEEAEKKKEKIVYEVENLLKEIRKYGTDFIFVTNEIGLGGVSPNRLGRYFSQVCGEINRMVAEAADCAYLVVSGIPVLIKEGNNE